MRRGDGPRVFRLRLEDGQEVDSGLVAVHWEIARMLLDGSAPRAGEKPAPDQDDMVRDWYRATAAWMALHEDHDILHLNRGREIFRHDTVLMFLSGCQREAFAAPHIQIPTRSASIPSGYAIPLESERVELRRAEAFFRRALESDPNHVEARLRLGHVLGRLGRHGDAARELTQRNLYRMADRAGRPGGSVGLPHIEGLNRFGILLHPVGFDFPDAREGEGQRRPGGFVHGLIGLRFAAS